MSAANPTGVAPGLQIHPTAFCNLACAHCYTSSGPQVRGELPPARLEAFLAEAAAMGYRDMAVSGGEPLLYSGLPGLLQAARALGMGTSLTTNALVLPEDRWAASVPLLDRVAVSIDGRPEEHDLIRRRAGAFGKTVANAARIRDDGVPFGVIFTLTQHNADSLDFVVRLSADLGARFVQVHPLTLHGRALTDMAESRPDALERLAALAEATRLGQALGIPVHVDVVRADQLRAYPRHFVPKRPVGCLTEVAATLVVDPTGAIVPLTHEIDPRLHLGRLGEAPLAALAARWLADGRADALAAACARAWEELAAAGGPVPFYWYDEVAARTGQAAQALFPLPRVPRRVPAPAA